MFVIIDDGWQSVGMDPSSLSFDADNAANFANRLTRINANHKFQKDDVEDQSNGFSQIISEIIGDHNLMKRETRFARKGSSQDQERKVEIVKENRAKTGISGNKGIMTVGIGIAIGITTETVVMIVKENEKENAPAVTIQEADVGPAPALWIGLGTMTGSMIATGVVTDTSLMVAASEKDGVFRC